jgi:hypothetical protein
MKQLRGPWGNLATTARHAAIAVAMLPPSPCSCTHAHSGPRTQRPALVGPASPSCEQIEQIRTRQGCARLGRAAVHRRGVDHFGAEQGSDLYLRYKDDFVCMRPRRRDPGSAQISRKLQCLVPDAVLRLRCPQTECSQRGDRCLSAGATVADMYQLENIVMVVSVHSHKRRNPR